MTTETDQQVIAERIKELIEIESSRIKERDELTKALAMARKYLYLSSIQEDEEDDDVDSECSCDACNDKLEPVKQKQD